MDDILFYIALLVIWIFSQLLGGKKKKKKAPQKPRPVSGERTSGPTTLEEALREIQEALNPTSQPRQSPPNREIEPVFEPEPAARSEPAVVSPRPLPPPAPKRVPVQTMTYEDYFEQRPEFEGERFVTLEGAQVSEDRFEARPPFMGDRIETGLPVAPLKLDKSVQKSVRRTRNVVNLRNTDTKGLQKAFVLGTVLGPPKSKRR